jgi:hypothetical protein
MNRIIEIVFFLIFLLNEVKHNYITQDVHCIPSNHQEVLVLGLLREIIFCNYKNLYIHKSKKKKKIIKIIIIDNYFRL